jgi:hypothetical protein
MQGLLSQQHQRGLGSTLGLGSASLPDLEPSLWISAATGDWRRHNIKPYTHQLEHCLSRCDEGAAFPEQYVFWFLYPSALFSRLHFLPLLALHNRDMEC